MWVLLQVEPCSDDQGEGSRSPFAWQDLTQYVTWTGSKTCVTHDICVEWRRTWWLDNSHLRSFFSLGVRTSGKTRRHFNMLLEALRPGVCLESPVPPHPPSLFLYEATECCQWAWKVLFVWWVCARAQFTMNLFIVPWESITLSRSLELLPSTPATHRFTNTCLEVKTWRPWSAPPRASGDFWRIPDSWMRDWHCRFAMIKTGV